MEGPKTIIGYILFSVFFLPVFCILFLIGLTKAIIMTPLVLGIVCIADIFIMVSLFLVHWFWSTYCIVRTKKFGPWMKALLVLIVIIPLGAWTVVGLHVSIIMGVIVGFGWPFLETFKAISEQGVPFIDRINNCFSAGLRSSFWGSFTVVRDFKDFSWYSFFSVVDELLKYEGDEPIELKVRQLPGCLLAVCVGILIDVPMIIIITIYKAPILLFKGWYRLVQDLIGREGPFLESVCVPFAGVWILLWPFAVIIAIIAGFLSSIGFGCFAAAIAYQESSTKKGLLYVIAAAAIFDEYTNDLLYLREGSCFPRPKYREHSDSGASSLPVSSFHEQHGDNRTSEPLMGGVGPPSIRTKALHAVAIWDNFFKSFEDIGKELLAAGAIGIADLDAWKASKNKIVNIGIPAYSFLECFFSSIRSGSPGFLLRNNVEITSVNRPEGRVFDWLYDPMSLMKEQIRSYNLEESEELYLYKYCLYSGDMARIDAWQNGGVPPQDPIRRAQLEGIGRRLQGFCLTISRLPTSRRRFFDVVNAIEQEAFTGLRSGAHDIKSIV